jgi:hypothetical protein
MASKSGSYGDVVVHAQRRCRCGFYSFDLETLRQSSNLRCVCCGSHSPRVVKTIRKEPPDTDEDVAHMCTHEIFMTSVAARYGFAFPVVETGANLCSFTTFHAGRSLDYALRHVPREEVKSLLFFVVVRAMQMGLCGIRHLDLNLGNVCVRKMKTARTFTIFGRVFETQFDVHFIDFGISELRGWCLDAVKPDPGQYFPGSAAAIEQSTSTDIWQSTAEQLCANFFKGDKSISWHLAGSFSSLGDMIFHDAAQFVVCCYMHFRIHGINQDCLSVCEAMLVPLKAQTEKDNHAACIDIVAETCGISHSPHKKPIHNLDTPISTSRKKRKYN